MLSKYLKILPLCFFCAFAGKAYGQINFIGGNSGNGDNFSDMDKGTPMALTVEVDRSVILTGNPLITNKIIQVRASDNVASLALKDMVLTMTSVGTNDLVTHNLLNGLFFSPGFASTERYSFGKVNNLWQGRTGDEVAQNSGNVWRDASFNFFFDPSQIPDGVKPGTYKATYQLVAKNRNPFITPAYTDRRGRVFSARERQDFLSRVSELQITLIVKEYLIVQPLIEKPVGIHIQSLAAFKAGKEGGYKSEDVKQTYQVKANVPFNMTLGTSAETFEFSNGKEKDNSTPVAKVSSIIEASKAGQSKGPLSSAGRIYVVGKAPDKNATNLTIDFELSAADLSAYFLRAGTYHIEEANLMFSPQNPAIPQAEPFKIKPFEVVVDPLSELLVNKNQVDLVFQTIGDYQNGVQAEVKDNLSLSSTTKYNLTVRAGSPYFTGLSDQNAKLPCSLLSIGLASSGLNSGPLNQVQLSTVAQNILSGENAVLDKNVSINYSIKPDKQLVKAKKITYSLEVIYGITAL